MPYNFLRDARYISNSSLCRYDSLNSYESDFSQNGNVDGWDIYNLTYLYGCWNGSIFGTAYDRSCYVSRNNVFPYVNAEDYYFVRIMMKITNNNIHKTVTGLTTGRIQWATVSDGTWTTDKQIDFSIIADDQWHLYEINMGPEKNWVGYINNLKIYPFIDGFERDQFTIKSIKISSYDKWVCTNTSCSYYTNYAHNCAGAGVRASREAGISRAIYTTVSGVSDDIIVNIDNYGDEHFNLGDNSNLNGIEMSRVISNALANLNVGAYMFSSVEYSENDEIKITSGNTSVNSSVVISDTPAARALGFFDVEGNDVSVYESGVDMADGFDYTASRIFTSKELNKMVDGDITSFAYLHNPYQFNVEGGRRDFNEVGSSRLISDLVSTIYYESLNNKGNTIIDLSHPINNNGRIKAIYIYGIIEDDSPAKIKICRPHKNGELTVIHSLALPTKESDTVYTISPLSYKIDCDILVSKGDLIGVYNANIYVGTSITGLPDATFYQISGEASSRFDPGGAYSFGVAGLAIYAKSERLQTNAIIEINMGNRINIEQVDIYGEEYEGYYEFNLCSCLDVDWQVDLFGDTHFHHGLNWNTGISWTHEHTNIAYGTDCLDDMVVTPDNGQQGDSYYSDNGLATDGPHAYFYVNGDTEWFYSGTCTGRTEYCWPNVPDLTYGFERDPVQFTLFFPNTRNAKVCGSKMYFKERNNFRNMGISYYLGSKDATGNAEDPYFRYISNFNGVLLDGLLYDENDPRAPYLFNNPTSSDGIYLEDGIQNEAEVRAALMSDWTIIEHRFDEVDCKGFRIYCDKHYSTKIMELEVYSRIQTDPSLVDNITMSFSDYGNVWKSASFDEIKSEHVSAFVGGAPQFFRIEFESSTTFNINEIEMAVGDQVQLESCTNNLLLEESKTDSVNSAIPLVLENTYDKPFDLTVDVPKETYESSDIIFWSTLDSVDSIESPGVGPGCILRKEYDYTIKNDNAQCAINATGYGLKNLIHNKEAYYSYTEGDSWVSFGTLSSGVSIDFMCDNPNRLKSDLYFTGVSSKYWQIVGGVDQYITLDSLRAFYNGTELNVYNLQSDYRNANYIPILTNDALGSIVYSNWTEYQSQAGDDLDLSFDGIEAVSYGDADGGPYIETILAPDLTDFTMLFDFINYRSVIGIMAHIDVYGYDSVGTEILRWHLTDSWIYGNEVMLYVYEKGSLKFSTSTVPAYNDGVGTNKATIQRYGSNLLIKIDAITYYNSTFVTDAIHRIDIHLNRSAGYASGTKLAVYFGNSFCFDLGTSEPLNKLELKHTNDLSDDVDVYVSADGITYTKWDDAVFLLHNNTFYDYFAIDLENTHSLDFIRNYGISTDKLLLHEGILDYSNSNTSNINDVVWSTNIEPVLLLHCDGNLTDYSSSNHTPTGGSTTTVENRFGSGSLDSQVDFADSVDWDFGTGDFTIDWWMYKTATFGVGKDIFSSNRTGGTSWLIQITSSIFHFYHNGGNIFGKSYTETLNTWKHWAFVRQGDNMYLFLDGVQQGSTGAGHAARSINGNVYLRICGDALDPPAYMDEIRIVKGTAVWTSNFIPPFVSYDDSWDDVMVKENTRWIRFSLLSGDGDDRYLRKIGIYPDINMPYTLDGDVYNCGWESLGNIFTDYTQPLNVAYGGIVTNTNNYFGEWYPTNAVDGITDEYNMADCWGFQQESGVDPYLEIDFGQLYTIYQVKLYHGYNPADYSYMNTDYIISVATSTSGSFTQIESISGNSDHYRMHQFDPVEARIIRLTITGYSSERILDYDEETGSYEVFNGSFLREMKVYRYIGIGYVDSESWPVVCVNLLEPFNIIDHELINKNINDTDTDWDNDESFFTYSDSVFDDPHKVSFDHGGEWVTKYSSTDASGGGPGQTEYVFDINQYFSEGRYRVFWKAYSPSEGEISLRLDGNQVVDLFADVLGSDWVDQEGVIEVPEDGFYDVKGIQHLNANVSWGVKSPLMQRAQDRITWVSVKRDTAENYSYDNDSVKYGKDYLHLIKIYGDDKYVPTEYYWWWSSTLSTLSNDYMNVQTNSRSLQVDYPASSGTDTISFLSGDDFGKDIYWSIKDLLSFWWKIDDINALDTSFGDITFGNMYDTNQFYYRWNINKLNLNTGWNLIKLKFEDYDYVYPEVDESTLYGFIDDYLDLRINDTDLKSIMIRYRGKNTPFTMYLDDICIKRNIFEEIVKFDEGLCLTGRESLDIPAAGLTLEQGSVEFWLKPYCDSYGRDAFGNIASKTFFTIVNNNNDIVSLGLKGGSWFEVSTGNLRTGLNKFDFEYANLKENSYIERNEVVHLALSWSNDSKFMDNSNTVRFYINGKLLYTSDVQWEVSDTKSVNIKIGGGNTQLSYAHDSYGAGVFDNIKIYSYAKSNFSINTEGIETDIVYTPNDFLEISSDNINFYGIGSDQLPLIFEQVPSGDKKTVYIRSNKDYRFKQSKKTADLIVNWLTTV